MIQSLERRTFMSATAATLTADAATLNTDASAVVAARVARSAATTTDVNAIVADLRAIYKHASLAQKMTIQHEIVALRAGVALSNFFVVKQQSIFVSYSRLDANAGLAHGKALLLHPTSAAISKLVAKDITNLNSYPAGKLSLLMNELSSATYYFKRYMDAIAVSTSSVSSTVTTLENDVASHETAIENASGVVVADATNMANDLSTIPGA
jgi:hypothetical protein